MQGLGINPGLSKVSLDLNNISLPVQTEILGILPWLSALKELEVENICMADANQLNALNKLSNIERLVCWTFSKFKLPHAIESLHWTHLTC